MWRKIYWALSQDNGYDLQLIFFVEFRCSVLCRSRNMYSKVRRALYLSFRDSRTIAGFPPIVGWIYYDTVRTAFLSLPCLKRKECQMMGRFIGSFVSLNLSMGHVPAVFLKADSWWMEHHWDLTNVWKEGVGGKASENDREQWGSTKNGSNNRESSRETPDQKQSQTEDLSLSVIRWMVFFISYGADTTALLAIN